MLTPVLLRSVTELPDPTTGTCMHSRVGSVTSAGELRERREGLPLTTITEQVLCEDCSVVLAIRSWDICVMSKQLF